VRLSFSVAGEQIVCTVAAETLSHKTARPFDRARVAALGRETLQILTRGNRSRKLTESNLADLRHVGEELWRALVPPEAQEELKRGSGPLLLELDEALVAVPWELLYDGEKFLCRRWDIGRAVATAQARRGAVARSVGMPIRILVMVSDPRGDLAEVQAEGEAIAAELDKHTAVRARLVAAPKIEFARRSIKDYDVLHFAGHADYVAGAPDRSGWHLVDGKLSAGEVAGLGGGRPMPILVFSNACQSGHTEPWTADSPSSVYGLANAFLLAGARHYVGTQWEVVDGQSATFAAAFYAELVTGAAIGAAVRRARESVVAQGGEGELAWATYVLYGDPEFAPLKRAESKGILPIPSAKALDVRSSAPWKRPRVREPGGASPAAHPAAKRRRPLVAALLGAAIGIAITAATMAIAFSHCR
jgi:CHAT domain-containing protein